MSDHGQNLSIVDELWRQLSAIDTVRDRRVRRSLARRRTLRIVAIAILTLLLLAALGVAGRTLLFGRPAPATIPVTSGNDLIPGSARLLAIRTADPGGGPPWGLRVAVTKGGGEGCLQTGRVVNGRLVALGVDGAFHDDGRAHALPASATDMCGRVDSHRYPIVAGGPTVFTAAATLGDPDCRLPAQLADTRFDVHTIELRLRHPHAYPPDSLRRLRRDLARDRRLLAHPPAPCPPADRRRVIMGVLGARVRAVTMDAPTGPAIREHVSAADRGAFLFVLRNVADTVHVPLSVRYASGLVCPLLVDGPYPGQPLESGECMRAHAAAHDP